MQRFSWVRFIAVLKKEFIHILRDRASLVMSIGMPIGMLLLFGYAVNTDVEHLPTVVWDQSQTTDSRDFITSLRNTQYLNPDNFVQGYKQIADYLDSGKARVAVIIPPNYGKNLQGNVQANVQVLVDGSDPTVARAAMSAVQMLGLNKSLQLQNERLVAMGTA